MKLKATVVFTRNDKSETKGLMRNVFYCTSPDSHADITCPELTRIMFELDEEHNLAFTGDGGFGFIVGVGYGYKSRDKLHIIDDFNHISVCEWFPRGAPDGDCNPLIHYDKKYKICINCRRYIEQRYGGE